MPTNHSAVPFRFSSPQALRADAETFERLSEAAEARADLPVALFFAEAAQRYTHPVFYADARRAITRRVRALHRALRPRAGAFVTTGGAAHA